MSLPRKDGCRWLAGLARSTGVRLTLLLLVGSAATAALLSQWAVSRVWGDELQSERCGALHARLTAPGPDGRAYPTWHPPSVALPDGTVCHFGHEHGSDPAQFVGAAAARPLAFGWVGTAAGHDEPHEGFKVFVVDDDTHGLAYRIVLHQGTGHGRRALTQHHEVQFAVADAVTGELLADTGAMADFGAGRPNCRPDEPLPGSFTEGEHGAHTPARRTVPTTDCAARTPYETWRMDYRIGTPDQQGRAAFASGATFDIDDPATVLDPADPTRLVFLCEARDSQLCQDPAGTDTAWKGTRRGVVAPRVVLWNAGPARFITDAFGRLLAPVALDRAAGEIGAIGTSSAPPGTVDQFVAPGTRLDFSGECCGLSVVFRESGGPYRAQSRGGPDYSAGMDDGSVHRPN